MILYKKMLGKEVDKMDNKELLLQLEKIISSNNYDIEKILEMVPDELKEELKNILKKNVQNESKTLKLEKSTLCTRLCVISIYN